ncbi:MAG: hypothetical protein HC882_05520 [Acidobacteria bacterium]|nr:hypothetical protein [Acidobacteriota bacterium]
MKRNSKVWGLLAGAAIVAMLVGGTAIASNMGFKFVPNVGANSFFNLALPWNQNYAQAKDLFDDLSGTVTLSKVNADGTLTNWFSGASTSQNYAITKAEAYIVEAGPSGVNTAVIVGSHDPNYTVSFAAGGFSNAAAPYHQTFTRANQLYNDFGTQLGATAISNIAKVNTDGTRTIWFAGASSSQNFTLDLGMGVVVEANTGGSGYVWPHY